jgi:hypothetical protein
VRWRRFAILMIPSAAVAAVLTGLTATGSIAASISVSGNNGRFPRGLGQPPGERPQHHLGMTAGAPGGRASMSKPGACRLASRLRRWWMRTAIAPFTRQK